MKLNKTKVQELAHLARLEFSDEELIDIKQFDCLISLGGDGTSKIQLSKPFFNECSRS